MKYLYGAAVQGIQAFIFQTNELKDIVGASELVENICKERFEMALEKVIPNYVGIDLDENAIINAAGNIKYVFDDKEICRKVVRVFPKEVISYAPGITVSQAVVEYDESQEGFETAIDNIEEKLRVQRNKPMASTTMGLMGIRRSRKTGLPVVGTETVKGNTDFLDAATLAKRYHLNENGEIKQRRSVLKLPRIAFGNDKLQYNEVALDVDDIKGKNDWIAVIHADGNGLGQVVQKIGKNAAKFKEFSKKLDKATKAAAVSAYKDLIAKKVIKENEKVIPIRPIVLGGDDFTVICRGDIALEYVNAFIKHFEEFTQFEELEGVFLGGEKKLTACAGIAFVKSAFPFYYGYELAEALCGRAKKDAKKNLEMKDGKMGLAKSCLMFHKVQDSFIDDFDDIAQRELQPQKNISFEFGPYYINTTEAKDEALCVNGSERWYVETLVKYVNLLDGKGLKDEKRGNSVKTSLRNWLSLLHNNPGLADQKLYRFKELLRTDNEDDKKLLNFVKKVTSDSNIEFKTPVYDILGMLTIGTQETNN